MANALGLYSGPAQLALYDASNGWLHLGALVKKCRLDVPTESVELLDGQFKQIFKKYVLTAEILKSDPATWAALKTRQNTDQTIYITGMEALWALQNMKIVLGQGREFGKDGHVILLNAQTTTEADVSVQENLLGSAGGFETDGGGGVASGWTKSGTVTTSIVASFLSGGGNCQALSWGPADTGEIYREVTCPLAAGVSMNYAFSVQVQDNASGIRAKLVLEFRNVSGSVVTTKQTSIAFSNNEQKQVVLSGTYVHEQDIVTLRARITLDNDANTYAMKCDNAQLELGEVTNFKTG